MLALSRQCFRIILLLLLRQIECGGWPTLCNCYDECECHFYMASPFSYGCVLRCVAYDMRAHAIHAIRMKRYLDNDIAANREY